MAVTKKKAAFVCRDGEEFATEADAARHEELLDATTNFSEAQRRLNRAATGCQLTADGEPFDVTRWGDYWFLAEWHQGGPALCRVSFGYGTEFQLDQYGGEKNSQLELVVFKQHTGYGNTTVPGIRFGSSIFTK